MHLAFFDSYIRQWWFPSKQGVNCQWTVRGFAGATTTSTSVPRTRARTTARASTCSAASSATAPMSSWASTASTSSQSRARTCRAAPAPRVGMSKVSGATVTWARGSWCSYCWFLFLSCILSCFQFILSFNWAFLVLYQKIQGVSFFAVFYFFDASFIWKAD